MFDLTGFMTDLAAERPIFHSEADFQHAFAWYFHQLFPDATVRLEYPMLIDKWIYVDIWLALPKLCFAIELKYKTLRFEFAHNEEYFGLKNQAAQDLGRYDFLKDVMRLEQIASMKPDIVGYAILLTNDASYWGTGRVGTVDTNFRLHHGRDMFGELSWLPNAGAGTIKNRQNAIILSRNYTVEWKPFSKLTSTSGGEFRYLVLTI